MDERDRVSIGHAYRAMIGFLEVHWERTHADEVAALLGSMNLSEDGRPMDPAMWHDWLLALERAESSGPN